MRFGAIGADDPHGSFVRVLQVYAEKPADKRPVWVIRPDGTDATIVEPLRFQMAIDGSRASWKPMSR